MLDYHENNHFTGRDLVYYKGHKSGVQYARGNDWLKY